MPEKFPSSEGEDFLKEKYPDLPKSPEVESAVKRQEIRGGEKVGSNPKEKIGVYLDRLNEIFNPDDADKKERRVDILKDKLHDRFVIKEVPEGYFKQQQKIAREQGHGDIEITDQLRQEALKTITADQAQSLDAWVDYLGSSDATYPDWLKYWAMRSVTSLTQGEKDENGKVSFSKREFAKYDKDGKLKNNPTVKPFPDLNREALAYVLDALEKNHKRKSEEGRELQKIKEAIPKDVVLTNKQEQEIKNRIREDKKAGEPTDERWEKILKSENFADLYAHAIEKITPASEEEKENIQGEWVKYDQGSNAKPLYESLQGHGTGWCTAGESVAITQLEAGDFYVFYSQDNQGLNKIPRVAIRTQGGEVVEVRGIDSDQNLEPTLVDIAREKYSTLPGGDQYEKKASDMKRLTEIENKFEEAIEIVRLGIALKSGKEQDIDVKEKLKNLAIEEDSDIMGELKKRKLTKEDRRFLYEVDDKIEGFGYQEDPRIEELKEKSKSIIIEYFLKVLNCEPGQVALRTDEINDETVALIGTLDTGKINITEMPKNLTYVLGSVRFGWDSKVKNSGKLRYISGNLMVHQPSEIDFSKVKHGKISKVY